MSVDPAPSVSVVIPVHNGAAYLDAALASVRAQTRPPAEIIAIDDGSTDGSSAILARHAPAVTRVTQSNRGTGAARNAGVAIATGTLIAFLDQDDLWLERKLELQVARLMSDPGADGVFGLVAQFRGDGPPGPAAGGAGTGELMQGHIPSALLVRREALARVGAFDTAWMVGEWADWYARARDAGLVLRTPMVHVAWRRLHDANKGLMHRDRRIEYARILKRSLDRRRAS